LIAGVHSVWGERPDVLLWIGLGLLAWAIYSQKLLFFIAAGVVLAIKLMTGIRT